MGTNASTTEPSPKPVEGSVVLALMPAQPQPRAAWASLFPVAEQSPRRARLETETFLANCQGIPDDQQDAAVLLVSELVTNAFKAMQAEPLSGIACIELSLRMFDGRLLIEVIDSSPGTPVPNLASNPDAENWRGLAVVDHISQEWGWFWRAGRKVVYCILPVPAP